MFVDTVKGYEISDRKFTLHTFQLQFTRWLNPLKREPQHSTNILDFILHWYPRHLQKVLIISNSTEEKICLSCLWESATAFTQQKSDPLINIQHVKKCVLVCNPGINPRWFGFSLKKHRGEENLILVIFHNNKNYNNT